MKKDFKFKFYEHKDVFTQSLHYTRGFFKGGQWVNIEEEHNHEKGICKKQAIILYVKECEKLKKILLKEKIIPDTIQLLFHLNIYKICLVNEYQLILSIMKVLNKNYINEKDMEKIISNVDYYYDNYFDIKNKNVTIAEKL